MEAEDYGRGAMAIDKRCRLAEATADKDERKAEESISNPKTKDEAEEDFVQNLASGRHHGKGGGVERHNRIIRYLYGATTPVRRKRTMDVGTGKRLLSRRFSFLGLVPLFTRGWCAEERREGRNGEQELIGETSEIGCVWEIR